MQNDYEEIASIHGLNSNPSVGRVVKINFDTGMIETSQYPIASFIEDAERNLKIVPPDGLDTKMGVEWGSSWDMILEIIKEHGAKNAE